MVVLRVVALNMAVLALALASAGPLMAQSIGPASPDAPIKRAPASSELSHEAPINGVLTLYGNQRCPTNNSGAEVVVCVRRGAAEQFRIPKELRDFKVTPQNQSWAKQQSLTLGAGAAGINSCSTVGPSAGSGCLMQNTTTGKAEARERQKDATPDLSRY